MKVLSLTNTLHGKKEPFVPQAVDPVRMYVCGITPYDYAHLGHGRCYVVFDVLYRLLELLGYKVTYVRNFTDIDDKLLKRAEQEYGDPYRYSDVAGRFIAAFHSDMQALNCLVPTIEPRVTDHIQQIIDFVQGLIEKNKAYVIDGDVYFSIDAYPAYGELSKRDLADLQAGARVAIREKKKNPLDFALWKAEPAGTFWQSPWGYGRPGWHIECSAMARSYLGDTVDLHGGGMDLIFPHHENELAQSQALTEKSFVRSWMHVAFVQVNQEKMSKSLGNFFTLRELFKKYDPMVIRYMLLTHHYRSPLDFSLDELEVAQKSYQRLCKAFEGYKKETDISLRAIENSVLGKKMLTFLLDDLNTQGLFGVVFEHLTDITKDKDARAIAYFLLTTILGLSLQPLPEKEVVLTPEIEALLQEREEARKNRDWARADVLREQLKALGIEVQDKKV